MAVGTTYCARQDAPPADSLDQPWVGKLQAPRQSDRAGPVRRGRHCRTPGSTHARGCHEIARAAQEAKHPLQQIHARMHKWQVDFGPQRAELVPHGVQPPGRIGMVADGDIS